MSEFVKETSEYVEMSDSITLCIVKDGAAGTSLNMKTGISSIDKLPTSGMNTGDSYIIDGHLWTYTGTTVNDATHHNGFTDCGKVSGEAGKNNYVHIAWSNEQNPAKEDIVLSNTDGKAYAYMGTWVSETKDDTADEAVKMAKWVYVKGDKGDTPEIAKLRVDHSVCHFSRTSNSWDYSSVTVSIVIMNGGETEIPAYGDTTKYFWRLSTDDTSTKRSSGMGFSASLTASSVTVNLYKTGSDENVAIDTITVPMVFDGKDGDGTPGVSYRLVPMSDRSATIKASNSSTNATFALHYTLHYKAVKMVGDSSESATIATIAATIEDKTVITTVNNTEGTLSGTGTKSYTSDNRPADSIPVTVTLSDGTVLYDNVPVTMEAGVAVDINEKLGKITTTLTDPNGDFNTIKNTANSNSARISTLDGRVTTVEQTGNNISLKVQDLQNGGIDTGKPHTSSQVDFTTLDSSNFYPVMIKLKNDDGVRHSVMIDRPLNAAYGSGKGYMTHGQGFSFRLVFSDIANAWGSYEYGQLRIESISQRWTTPSDTPICPKIAQYYMFSFMVVWLRGGSKYDVTVDCTDAYISGIWPYMMQVASNPSWVPDAVRLANGTWTTAQVNAQSGNPYNLLKHDDDYGYYADVTNKFLYRFGSLEAKKTFAIVGQPTDSKTWFIASWTITRVSGSKVYVDVSTYGLLWQTQNPLGINMDGKIGYIKSKNVTYGASTWGSQSGFGTTESISDSDTHATWLGVNAILVVGKESEETDGVHRDRAVLETVNTITVGSSVSFFDNTYFDVSPLYGTDGRVNVKPDMLATGIDIKSHKIMVTTDNFVVRNNSGETTSALDADGNLKAGSLTCQDKETGVILKMMHGFFTALKGKAGVSLGVDKNGYPCLMGTDPNGNVLWRLGQTYETADQDSKVTMEVVSMKAYGQMNSYAIGEGVILTLNVTNNTNAAITINTSNMHMVLKSEFGTYRGNVDVVTNISVGATAQVVLRGTEAIDTSSSSSTYTSPVGRSVTAVVVYQGDMRLTQDAEYQYQEGLRKDSDGNVQYTLPLM